MAKATEGNLDAGAHQLREAVDFARSSRADLEFEVRMLADLAEVLVRAGDPALQATTEAL